MNTVTATGPARDSDCLLELQAVGFDHGTRHILHDINLAIRPGQILTLIGPNGAGKTTLVKVAMGLLSPTRGKVHISPGLRIGYMPQRLQIENTMPVSVRRFLQLVPGAGPAAIIEALGEVGAPALLESSLHDLSGGEMQRVLLARALLLTPALLVLDEPTQGVDLKGQAELYRLISRIRDRHNCGVLMVSHDLHLVMSATDEVICLNQHVCCHGHPEQVSNDPAYLEMFGRKGAEAMAVYTHHHNHEHDLAGEVVEDHSHP